MRVTNKMIMNNASSNINSTKETVNKRNTQMTSQKRIDKPSDDPVIAVRSLRLSTTLSQVTQYYSKNIPDANQWLDVTETALINMRDIVKDCRELAVTGSNDPNNQDDRKTILTQLEALQSQLYAEGNADYAKRTVFTGYRTNSNLTFTENESLTKYRIDQTFVVADTMEEKRFYSGSVEVPTTEDEVVAPKTDPSAISDIVQTNYYRVRFNYDDIDSINSINIGGFLNETFTENAAGVFDDSAGITSGNYVFKTFANETDWANSGDTTVKGTAADQNVDAIEGLKLVGDYGAVFIKETGELILGAKLASELKSSNASITVQYDKTGFDKGELRPEYYYNCTKLKDEVGAPLTDDGDFSRYEYKKFNDDGSTIHFDIEYTIAASQTIAINTEASDVFDSSLQRDLGEMINAIQKTIAAYDKVDTIKDMKGQTQYASDEDQEWLDKWQDAAQKEFDFYSNNMQKLFNTELGKIDSYYAKISLAITDLGCKVDSLKLTETRVGDQRETVQDLQSKNDDIDLSQIIIDYTAAYTAYQSSLTAAGKLSESTLLNYI